MDRALVNKAIAILPVNVPMGIDVRFAEAVGHIATG